MRGSSATNGTDAADVADGQWTGRPAAVRRLRAAVALVVGAAPWIALLYVVLTLVSAALPVLAAWITKLIIDNLVSGQAADALVPLVMLLAFAAACTAASMQVMPYLQNETDRAVGFAAQDRLFTAVGGFLGLVRFENPHFLDRLRLAKHSGGTSPHPSQAMHGALGVGRAIVTIGGFLGTLFLISPLMAALVLLSGLPTLAAQYKLSRKRVRMYWEIGGIERREFFYDSLLSSVEAAKEVRLFGIGGFLRERMLADRRTANHARRVMDRQQAIVQTGLGVLAAGVSGGGLVWAVLAAQQGRISVGDVMIFTAAVVGVQSSLTSVASDIARMHQALLMFDHYLGVTTVGQDLPIVAKPRSMSCMRKGIEVRNVWFRYSTEHPWVLRGVNLWIPHGGTVALVGLNGAGKSTLVKLLCRFYDPNVGVILWDGVDIRDFDPADLRSRIGAVFQDYMRYDMTAAENIALGDLGSLRHQERIECAAKRAGIHKNILTLPKSYSTLLSRIFFMESDKNSTVTGVVLSGGQWQRLALARAYLRGQSDLMILDEPSAGLDAEAEHEIHTSLEDYRRGKTSLLISHRLGAIRDAGQIVVLSDGEVVERGDHSSLLACGGEYARLFGLQAAGYQADEHPATAAGVSR